MGQCIPEQGPVDAGILFREGIDPLRAPERGPVDAGILFREKINNSSLVRRRAMAQANFICLGFTVHGKKTEFCRNASALPPHVYTFEPLPGA